MSSSDNIYRVNMRRLALLTLPTWLRRPVAGALIYAGVRPLNRLVRELWGFRQETAYRLGHNGQVCKLRAALNDIFDPRLRRITIEDWQGEASGTGDSGVVWQRETAREVKIFRRGQGVFRLRREGYSELRGYDFWVGVPDELNNRATETRLRAVINMYKPAGKRYAISYK